MRELRLRGLRAQMATKWQMQDLFPDPSTTGHDGEVRECKGPEICDSPLALQLT